MNFLWINIHDMTKYIAILFLVIITCSGYSQETPFSEDELKNFQQKAQDKASKFSEYLSIIASKSIPLEDREDAIRLACGLFISDTVRIQVSYCPKKGEPEIISRTLIDYLRRLCWLPYDEVKIEWVEFSVLGKLHRGIDGKYYGLIGYVQRFQGIKGDMIYEDTTFKTIEVVLVTYSKYDESGEEKIVWDVFLSNIKIEEPCID